MIGLSKRYQLLLIAVLVFAAYYPANFAGFSLVDDLSTRNNLQQIKSFDIVRLFIPEYGGGLYYRPVLYLTYVFDKYVHDLSPGFMHLENVLIHLCNVILIYYLAFNLIAETKRKTSMAPFVASLLFGLHPINTESVNWISGRTDLIACAFILMSTMAVMRYGEVKRRWIVVVSLLFFFCAVLVKETALAFLPGYVLLMSRSSEGTTQNNALKKKVNFKRNIAMIAGGSLVVLAFIVMRSMAFTSNASRISLTVMAATTDWIYSMLLVLRAFGFYMKKLLLPYPLNFAIVEVDPLYEILAVPLVALSVYIVSRKRVEADLFAAGLLLLAPAFILIFGQVAWTPYAERYLYISAAFIIPAAVVSAREIRMMGHKYSVAIMGLVFVLFFIASFQRSLIWQNDMSLLGDTVEKSPAASLVQGVYAKLLAINGNYSDAMKHLQASKDVPDLAYDERNDLTMVYLYGRQDRIAKAIETVNFVLKKTKGHSAHALKYMVDLLEIKRENTKSSKEKVLLGQRILSYNIERFQVTRDPKILFELGVNAESLGKRKRALLHYRQALYNFPKDDLYYYYAKTAINKLTAHYHHAN